MSRFDNPLGLQWLGLATIHLTKKASKSAEFVAAKAEMKC